MNIWDRQNVPFADYNYTQKRSSKPIPAKIYNGGTINAGEHLRPQTVMIVPSSTSTYSLDVEQTTEIIPNKIFGTLLVQALWATLEKGQFTAEAFVETVRLNAPMYGQDKLFQEAIEITRREEPNAITRRLVTVGVEAYPQSEVLMNYAKAFAPPRVIERQPARHNFSKTMRWLSAHSHEYVGQWIAVRDGELLDTTASLKALIAQLGTLADDETVMTTYIPTT